MQIEKPFNTFWEENKHDMNRLRSLEKSNAQEILEKEELCGLLKSFIEIAGILALGMEQIIDDYEDDKENVDIYKSQLADDHTYKEFKKLLYTKFPK